MTIEIDSDSSVNCGDIWEFTQNLTTQHGAYWQGRIVTQEDAMLCVQDISQSALSALDALEEIDDPNLDRLMAQLIWAGTLPENRALLEREIQYLVTGQNEVFIQEAGFKKTVSKFWHKHKKAIIITVVVVAVVATVVVVTVYSGGTGGGAATAAGGKLISDLCNEDDTKDHGSSAQPASPQIAPSTKPSYLPPTNKITSIEPAPTASEPQTLPQIPPEMQSHPLSLNGVQDYSPHLATPPPNVTSKAPNFSALENFPIGSTQFSAPLPLSMQPKSIEDINASQPTPSLFQNGKNIPPVISAETQRSLDALSPAKQPSYELVDQYKNLPFEHISPIWSAPCQPTDNMSHCIDNFDPVKLREMLSNATPEKSKEISEYIESIFAHSEVGAESMKPISEPIVDSPLPPPVGTDIFSREYKDMNALLTALQQSQKAPLPDFKPQATKLIGTDNQGKIHMHSGIRNSYETTTESGICLYNTLNKEYAVQPHWIHQNNLAHGLTAVGLEKAFSEPPSIPRGFACDPLSDIEEVDCISLAGYGLGKLGHAALNHSKIQESINYETKLLSDTAKEILEQNNPKLIQLHVEFSNASYVLREAIKQLPQEYKDTIIVIGVGPTTILDDSLGCQKVFNVIGDKDWPSKKCNGGEQGIQEAQENANVEIIKQNGTHLPFGGHYFIQPDYQKKIKEIITNNITGNYEIY